MERAVELTSLWSFCTRPFALESKHKLNNAFFSFSSLSLLSLPLSISMLCCMHSPQHLYTFVVKLARDLTFWLTWLTREKKRRCGVKSCDVIDFTITQRWWSRAHRASAGDDLMNGIAQLCVTHWSGDLCGEKSNVNWIKTMKNGWCDSRARAYGGIRVLCFSDKFINESLNHCWVSFYFRCVGEPPRQVSRESVLIR